MNISFTISLIIISLISCKDKVCRNHNGVEVDWYAIFFFPLSISPDSEIHYAYIDDTMSSLQYYKYDQSTFPPNQVTSYVNETTTNFNYFFWNDDLTVKDGSSKSADSSRAHAKGSLVYDKSNGAFIIHSLPRFPTRTSDNKILIELPSNAGSYAQHFYCMTITKAVAEKIVELLNYINVSNNASVNKDRVNTQANEWVTKLIANKFDSSYPSDLQTTLKSKAGVSYNFISKNYLNKIIPYDTTVRSIYKDDFYVRTWVLPTVAPASCEEYSIFNVLITKFGDYTYVKGKEHSKWAISKNKNEVCFADLNHCPSQANRGGNIVCFENQKLHGIMLNAVQSTDSC